MKAAAFDLDVPVALAAVPSLLRDGSRMIAGGQSLGPMLNLRVAQPERLVSIRKLPELCGFDETKSHVVIGPISARPSCGASRRP
jgi:carbon-monoxide dehydrogenase medium subunit